MKQDPISETHRWYYFIPASGPEGREWYQEYQRAGCSRLVIKLDRALGLVRRTEVRAGRFLLDEVRIEMETLPRTVPLAVRKVAERWYHSTLAYYLYAEGQQGSAKEELTRARECMEAAIEEAPCLVTLAGACCEFSLHYARISRRQNDWPRMWDAIESGRRMVRSQSPLCSLGTGRSIFYSDIDAFHRTITPMDQDEQDALDLLLNTQARIHGFEKVVRQIELLPNVVVSFT